MMTKKRQFTTYRGVGFDRRQVFVIVSVLAAIAALWFMVLRPMEANRADVAGQADAAEQSARAAADRLRDLESGGTDALVVLEEQWSTAGALLPGQVDAVSVVPTLLEVAEAAGVTVNITPNGSPVSAGGLTYLTLDATATGPVNGMQSFLVNLSRVSPLVTVAAVEFTAVDTAPTMAASLRVWSTDTPISAPSTVTPDIPRPTTPGTTTPGTTTPGTTPGVPTANAGQPCPTVPVGTQVPSPSGVLVCLPGPSGNVNVWTAQQ